MKMKQLKILFLTFFLVFAIAIQAQESAKAKYVFLFIGDGMGLAQVNLAQGYLSALNGELGMHTLEFTRFPSTGLLTTYANNRLITGSAAAATALATGHKTDIDRISMSPDKTEIYKSIAELAKLNGMRVGIVTSTALNHATPAAFYAHQPDRNMYFEIGLQLATSNFDYFAGGGLRDAVKEVDGKEVNLLDKAENNGFYLVKDVEDFKSMMRTRKKIIMLSPRKGKEETMPYSIDMGTADPTLADFTGKGIELLNGEEGFFMMVEGGKIDIACHADDAGTAIQEVLAFDQAVGLAVDFYNEHPDETLIVVTADHETGGLSLGNESRGYDTDLAVFQYQKSSIDKLTRDIKALREKKKGKEDEDFEKLLKLLNVNLGLNDKKNHTLLSEDELSRLKEMMVESLYEKSRKKGDYGNNEPLAREGLQILATKAGISWGTGTHTFESVPVYAIGAGAEEFEGYIDNTDIAKRIMVLMGLR